MTRVVAVAQLFAHSGQGESMRSLLEELGQISDREAGTQLWHLAQVRDRPDEFVITEVFDDQAAFLVHEQNPATKQVSERLRPFMARVQVTSGELVSDAGTRVGR